ncbi:hypothetical protein LCGC14_3015930 [marine sediment metagenome]|uniref:TFIIB-type domain-containing protein n=1 Tax=marine sediment metagenome TaxID=412755 RepID=A0A0F8WWM2_9ZZZZ
MGPNREVCPHCGSWMYDEDFIYHEFICEECGYITNPQDLKWQHRTKGDEGEMHIKESADGACTVTWKAYDPAIHGFHTTKYRDKYYTAGTTNV